MIRPGSEINYLIAALVEFVEKLNNSSVVGAHPQLW